MTETFNFDFFQTPHTGVEQPDMVAQTRTDANTVIRRPVDMKISNFGSYMVGARMPQSQDYTRVNLGFKAKGESEDWVVMTENGGIGSNVGTRGVTVIHNPLVWGSTVKYVRDDQFIRMIMSKDTGTSSAATQVDPPKFDVMDTKEATAEGIEATSNFNIKNWPSEGWRSFGGKYDFLPYDGGTLK
jgi:hypothetical protein